MRNVSATPPLVSSLITFSMTTFASNLLVAVAEFEKKLEIIEASCVFSGWAFEDRIRCASVQCVLQCTVVYCTVVYCTVLYCTVLYCTVLYSTVL